MLKEHWIILPDQQITAHKRISYFLIWGKKTQKKPTNQKKLNYETTCFGAQMSFDDQENCGNFLSKDYIIL